MFENRPKIQLSWEPIDIISELANIVILILIWAWVFVNYGELSDTIPTHFNALGEADKFGSKSVLIILPAVATFTYVLLFLINRYPHTHNYMVEITEKNAELNYRLSTRMLRYINLLCLIIIGILVYDIINISQNQQPVFIGGWFVFFTLAAPVILIIIMFRMSKQMNKKLEA